MTPSIRTFLLINLLLSVSLVTSLAIIGNLFLEHRDLQGHLDAQLSLVALTIQAFAQDNLDNSSVEQTQKQINAIPSLSDHYYYKEHRQTSSQIYDKIQFQVWDKKHNLLFHSNTAPSAILSTGKTGFSDKWINGEPWRVFTSYAPSSGLTIDVAERYDFREELEGRIIQDSILIMLVTYPFLGLLVWIVVSRGLGSLTRVMQEVSHRAPSYLEPVNLENVPYEIKPLVRELNELFQRLKDAFEREKRFAADAAHELRTPLAALKTQAQVALKTEDFQVRQAALCKLIDSVDRSTHVVQQLLTISRMVPEATLESMARLDLCKLATEVIADLVPTALEKETEIDLSAPPHGAFIIGSSIAISILIRNLVDNAIRYTPALSAIHVSVDTSDTHVELRVADNGPGIPEELRERVFERFFRILGNKVMGSGLGLGIVQQIAQVHHADITLTTPSWGKGLQVTIRFPRAPDTI